MTPTEKRLEDSHKSKKTTKELMLELKKEIDSVTPKGYSTFHVYTLKDLDTALDAQLTEVWDKCCDLLGDPDDALTKLMAWLHRKHKKHDQTN